MQIHVDEEKIMLPPKNHKTPSTRHCGLHAPDEKILKKKGWYNNRDLVMSAPMLRSQAYLTLRETTKVVLQLFMQRRAYELVPKTPGSAKRIRVFRDKGLKFPHTEALQYGIRQKTFRLAIIELCEHGFLVIVETGGQRGDTRICSVYDLIDDWQLYGCPDFKPRQIPKGICLNNGFEEYNKKRKEKYLTDGADCKPTDGADCKTIEVGRDTDGGADCKNLPTEINKAKRGRTRKSRTQAISENPPTGDGTDCTVIKARGMGAGA